MPSGLTSAHDRHEGHEAMTKVGSVNVGCREQRKEPMKDIKEHQQNHLLYDGKM